MFGFQAAVSGAPQGNTFYQQVEPRCMSGRAGGIPHYPPFDSVIII